MEKQSRIDPWLLVPTAGLLVFGLMAIYSATNGTGDTSLFFRQSAWALFGVLVLGFLYSNDVRFVKDNAYIFYAIGILLLVAVLIFGKKIAGQTSWMKIGGLSFQPSEIAKIATIIALARFFSDDEADITSTKYLLIALAISFAPVLLIMLQPDMGTMLTFLPLIATMLVMAGFDIYVLMLIVLGLFCIRVSSY